MNNLTLGIFSDSSNYASFLMNEIRQQMAKIDNDLEQKTSNPMYNSSSPELEIAPIRIIKSQSIKDEDSEKDQKSDQNQITIKHEDVEILDPEQIIAKIQEEHDPRKGSVSEEIRQFSEQLNEEKTTEPTSNNELYDDIQLQIQAADQRCESLEDQLASLKKIIEDTKEKRSDEIDRIIKNSRTTANLITQDGHFINREEDNHRQIDYNDFEFISKKATDKFARSKSSIPSHSSYGDRYAKQLKDQKFLNDVINKLKGQNLNKKQMKKVSEKIAKMSGREKMAMEELRKLRSHRKSGSLLPYFSDCSRPSTSSKTTASYTNNFLKGADLVAKKQLDNIRPKTARGVRARGSKIAVKLDNYRDPKTNFTSQTHSSRIKSKNPVLGSKSKSQSEIKKSVRKTRHRSRSPIKVPKPQTNSNNSKQQSENIPFIVGKSSSRSHNLNANLQALLHKNKFKNDTTKLKSNQRTVIMKKPKQKIDQKIIAECRNHRDYLKCIQEAQDLFRK